MSRQTLEQRAQWIYRVASLIATVEAFFLFIFGLTAGNLPAEVMSGRSPAARHLFRKTSQEHNGLTTDSSLWIYPVLKGCEAEGESASILVG